VLRGIKVAGSVGEPPTSPVARSHSPHIATRKYRTILYRQHIAQCCVMHDRTNRALAAIAEMDKRHISLCATCEGLLLTAAAGLPLPMIRDEEGELIDGEVHLNMLLARILADRAVG